MAGIPLEKFLMLAKEYAYIPLWSDLDGDLDTPVSLVKKLGGCVYLLESVEKGENLGRHSFIGLDPLLWFEVNNEGCRLEKDGQSITYNSRDPLKLLAETLQQMNVAPLDELQGFFGGAVGYFGYDTVRRLEVLPRLAQDDLQVPESKFVITRSVIAVDHVTKQVRVAVLVPGGENPARNFKAGAEYLKSVVRRLKARTIRQDKKVSAANGSFQSNVSKERYMAMVEQAKNYIRAGDIFQVVLSQRLTCQVDDEPFEIYRRLRTINPSPYLYFLDLGDTKLIGSSPEMLVRVKDREAETCPIAGTRPRGKSEREDRALARELLANEKERAEHIMLVDLSRNDLGRVCSFGTVRVEQAMEVERFSHVMHMVSKVKGELQAGCTAFDTLKVCFPAGTVSGAPKIRAMEIIEELEPTRRGPYAGAIGYLSFGGHLDSCITIRTILIKDNTAHIQAGAGIVADSDPEKEYEETLNKARALMNAVKPLQEEKLCY